MKIVLVDNQNGHAVSLRKARSLVIKALGVLGLRNRSLSINFVEKSHIRNINSRYFNRRTVTDVIALGYQDSYSGKRPVGLYSEYLGDIIICPDIAAQNARIYNRNIEQEIALYIVHGLLHLLGYQDTSTSKRKKMYKMQKEILSKIWKQ
jgi:probable rRNA maturation factor